jgi:hypothetical protein
MGITGQTKNLIRTVTSEEKFDEIDPSFNVPLENPSDALHRSTGLKVSGFMFQVLFPKRNFKT